MLTALFAACLLVQQQPRPQAKPHQQQSDTVIIQGRDFNIPHVPATEKQAKKEYRAVIKKINNTMDILEDDLVLLYKKYQGKDIVRDLPISKEKVAMPEAAFFLSVIKDEILASHFNEIIKQWNEWQRATVQAGAGKLESSREPQQDAAPQADTQPSRIPGVAYERRRFVVENVPVVAIPALRQILADWDIELKAIRTNHATRTVYYYLDLPVVASLQSVLGISKSDAKTLRMQKAFRTLMVMLPIAKQLPGNFNAWEAEFDTEEEVLEWELAGLSPQTEAMRLNIQIQQNFANVQIARVISELHAPEFSKSWESFSEYLNRRIREFTEMEASPLIYVDSDIKLLYEAASIAFMEQLRLSLWLCQNVWHRMAARYRESDIPKPLSKLAPYKVQSASADSPGSHIVLSEMSKKDLIDLAKAISRKDPRLFMIRLAQPIYVPNEGETSQAERTTVKVTIAMNGSVSGVEYVSGPKHLRELSLQAAKLLKFYPLKESGFTAPQSTMVTFSFD
jgi:hypothetical protein